MISSWKPTAIASTRPWPPNPLPAHCLQNRWDIKVRTPLACAYAAALGQGPVEVMQKRLEELFEKLEGISDTYTTNDHFRSCQLRVVEAVVLTILDE